MKSHGRKPSPKGQARVATPHTLAIDIGGTHLKAAVLDRSGVELSRHVEIPTPRPAPPGVVLPLLDHMLRSLPGFDRVSVGFPGVVKHGCIITAPNLGTDHWQAFPLAAELAQRWHREARVLNDAEVQGLAVIQGKGLECALTLGTGFGSAVYRDGDLMPHFELGQHPVWKGKTYDQYLGAAALAEKGVDKWNRRVKRMLRIVRTLLNFDHLYLGGGNATQIRLELPRDVTIVSNTAGLTGGVRLWDAKFDHLFP